MAVSNNISGEVSERKKTTEAIVALDKSPMNSESSPMQKGVNKRKRE
jgi:hypothetical protein